MDLNNQRILNKIEACVDKLELNLSGKIILTEVGSGLYKFTPLIALLGGADKVFAWTNDSRYGTAEANISACNYILSDSQKKKIDFYKGDFCPEHLEKADIVTNSGFIRPIDKRKLDLMKEKAVVPLMYEEWELRDSDIDIDYCSKKNIRVAGTWEDHPDIKVFSHVGPLAAKMAFEAGYEVFENEILVWSDDHFGDKIASYFQKLGARKVTLTTKEDVLKAHVKKIDFIFISDYSEKREYGKAGFFDFKKLSKVNPDLGIVHLFGKLNHKEISNYLPVVYPAFNGNSSVMTFTLAHVGINPFINLQVAGFKVGELILSGKESSLKQIIVGD